MAEKSERIEKNRIFSGHPELQGSIFEMEAQHPEAYQALKSMMQDHKEGLQEFVNRIHEFRANAAKAGSYDPYMGSRGIDNSKVVANYDILIKLFKQHGFEQK